MTLILRVREGRRRGVREWAGEGREIVCWGAQERRSEWGELVGRVGVREVQRRRCYAATQRVIGRGFGSLRIGRSRNTAMEALKYAIMGLALRWLYSQWPS
jgi:hypothetical protein